VLECLDLTYGHNRLPFLSSKYQVIINQASKQSTTVSQHPAARRSVDGDVRYDKTTRHKYLTCANSPKQRLYRPYNLWSQICCGSVLGQTKHRNGLAAMHAQTEIWRSPLRWEQTAVFFVDRLSQQWLSFLYQYYSVIVCMYKPFVLCFLHTYIHTYIHTSKSFDCTLITKIYKIDVQ